MTHPVRRRNTTLTRPPTGRADTGLSTACRPALPGWAGLALGLTLGRVLVVSEPGEPSGCPPPAEQLLTVTQRMLEGAVVVAVVGEVDTLTAPRLRAALDGALRSAAARRVVVDLLGVTFLGSAGLEALVQSARQAGQRREPLRIVVDEHQPVLLPIQITDLDEVLTLCYGLAEALTA
jgi:anti-sigma B factor antagonist